jgi:hypothetical protein
MPDPVIILQASAVAALLAAAAVLLAGRARPAWASATGAIGLGIGFAAGAWWLGLAPRFALREDKDRLFLVLLPAAVAAEVIAAFSRRAPWLGWLLRLAVAAGAAPVLLHGSSYLTDAAGPGTREWSPGQTWCVLGALAAALVTNQALLGRLARRAAGRSVLLTLALVAAGAGVTVMLSGYASGGQLAFPLTAGLGAAAVAALFLPEPRDLTGPVGVGVVGLFAVLVIGRFFGSLTDANAALVFFAPLLGWLPELLPAGRVGAWGRGFVRLALAAAPLAIVLMLAAQKFAADSAPPSSEPAAREPSIEDYMNFGK